MKIIMTLLVRDEEDIIRDNIEYHLSQGVDYIIATDNKSVDSTAAILKEYENKGILKYIYEAEDNYSQHKWVTRMARMAFSEYGADWIINNDADEFWWPVEGTLRDIFISTSPEINILQAQRYNYLLVDGNKQPFYKRMLYRELTSLNPLGKPLPPKVAHRACATIDVAQGNHSVTGIDNPSILHDRIDIFHYPIRSYKQIVNKIEKGGAAYERNTKLNKSIGSTWRTLYSEYKENNNLQSYFDEQFNDTKTVHEKLASNLVVEDRRLCDYIETQIKNK